MSGKSNWCCIFLVVLLVCTLAGAGLGAFTPFLLSKMDHHSSLTVEQGAGYGAGVGAGVVLLCSCCFCCCLRICGCDSDGIRGGSSAACCQSCCYGGETGGCFSCCQSAGASW